MTVRKRRDQVHGFSQQHTAKTDAQWCTVWQRYCIARIGIQRSIPSTCPFSSVCVNASTDYIDHTRSPHHRYIMMKTATLLVLISIALAKAQTSVPGTLSQSTNSIHHFFSPRFAFLFLLLHTCSLPLPVCRSRPHQLAPSTARPALRRLSGLPTHSRVYAIVLSTTMECTWQIITSGIEISCVSPVVSGPAFYLSCAIARRRVPSRPFRPCCAHHPQL